MRATGLPRFTAGIGAEAKAAQDAADSSLHTSSDHVRSGVSQARPSADAARRSRSPVDNAPSNSLEIETLAAGVGDGEKLQTRSNGAGAVACSVLESSLDRSLECEEL